VSVSLPLMYFTVRSTAGTRYSASYTSSCPTNDSSCRTVCHYFYPISFLPTTFFNAVLGLCICSFFHFILLGGKPFWPCSQSHHNWTDVVTTQMTLKMHIGPTEIAHTSFVVWLQTFLSAGCAQRSTVSH